MDFRIPRSRAEGVSDPEELAAMVVGRMWGELRTPYEPDPRLVGTTAGQRAVYALQWTRSEVNNGGFFQFFSNSTGMLAEEAVAGAQRIGADDVALIIREALDIFPDGRLISDNATRRGYMESGEFTDVLDALDDRFLDAVGFELPSSLAIREAAYVELHPEEFFSDG